MLGDISYTKILKNLRVSKAYTYLPAYIVSLMSRHKGHHLLGSPQGCAQLTPESRMKAKFSPISDEQFGFLHSIFYCCVCYAVVDALFLGIWLGGLLDNQEF